MKRALVVSLVVVLVVPVGWWLRARASHPAVAPVKVETAPVARERLVVTLPVNGSLESSEETDIRTEVQGKIATICENGVRVKPGDLILQLDTKEFVDKRDEAVKNVVEAREALNKADAEGQVSISQAESEVKKAEEVRDLARAKAQAQREKLTAEVAFAEGELARVKRELQRDQRLAGLHYIPGTKLQETEKRYRAQSDKLDTLRLHQGDLEKQTAEDLQSAELGVQLAQQECEAARTSLAASLDDARIRIKETERSLQEAEQNIAYCTIKAPTGGMAMVTTNHSDWMDQHPWRVGDELDPGDRALQIYNSEKMRVSCQIGEIDISRVIKGQLAYVLCPSRPGKRYRAKLTMVEEMARPTEVWSGDTPGKRTFAARVEIAEADPGHLKPGMTVDLEIVLADRKQVLAVPVRALFHEGKQAVVYRQRGVRFERAAVTSGVRGDLKVEVKGPLHPGERVALSRPPASLLAKPQRGGQT